MPLPLTHPLLVHANRNRPPIPQSESFEIVNLTSYLSDIATPPPRPLPSDSLPLLSPVHVTAARLAIKVMKPGANQVNKIRGQR